MTKEKRHRRRESPELKVKVKQERLSPERPQRSRRSPSGHSTPPRRRTSRSPNRTRERSPVRRQTSPGGRSRSPRRGADIKIKREREERGEGSGEERRRRNDQPEERRSRWESDRPLKREHGGERHRERGALSSQQAERQQHDERRMENRRRREESEEQNFGQPDEGNSDGPPPEDKEKPNFELSGALTEDTNTFRGVVIKYNEPPEARIPKRRWRLYPFKDDEPLPVMYIHRQSAYLLGRQRKIADIPIDHPSCSKQHAVFQYRLVEYTRSDGTGGRRVKPYIIDLASGNGTFLNNQRIEPQRYYELKEKDVLKFGFSSREYVLLHEFSDTSEVDAKMEEDDEGLDA